MDEGSNIISRSKVRIESIQRQSYIFWESVIVDHRAEGVDLRMPLRRCSYLMAEELHITYELRTEVVQETTLFLVSHSTEITFKIFCRFSPRMLTKQIFPPQALHTPSCSPKSLRVSVANLSRMLSDPSHTIPN
mmetsp:Transcript_5604/g.21087  ORF Transcript_5604/g.21087 Transcript_5604/m.21087 type:complete len:134 (-) Transcript_5604:1444-1845(-)